MSKEKEAVEFRDDAPAGGDGRAEWHPYSVWREHIHSDQNREDENIELTGSWKPADVWKRQIKRA